MTFIVKIKFNFVIINKLEPIIPKCILELDKEATKQLIKSNKPLLHLRISWHQLCPIKIGYSLHQTLYKLIMHNTWYVCKSSWVPLGRLEHAWQLRQNTGVNLCMLCVEI